MCVILPYTFRVLRYLGLPEQSLMFRATVIAKIAYCVVLSPHVRRSSTNRFILEALYEAGLYLHHQPASVSCTLKTLSSVKSTNSLVLQTYLTDRADVHRRNRHHSRILIPKSVHFCVRKFLVLCPYKCN